MYWLALNACCQLVWPVLLNTHSENRVPTSSRVAKLMKTFNKIRHNLSFNDLNSYNSD
jgi:hypothetical protein